MGMRLIALLAFILTFVPSLPAFAQTVVNPRTVEFDPSADHNALTAGGQALVARYDLEFYLVGATQPFQVQSLGKPAPGADGKVRVDFSTLLTAWPLPNGNYEARVAAVGPTGVGRSDPSNAFTYANCSFAVSPTSGSIGAGGGSGSVTLTTATGCAWTATSNAAWLIVSPASGTASAAVFFTAVANTTPATRTGTLIIGGQTFTIMQAAATCSFSLSALAQSVAASGASGSVTVTTMTGCSWTATSGASWVTVSPGSGSGSGTVSFTVAANTATTTRSATLTIGGQTFTITQAAAACTFSLSGASQTVAASGGSGTIALTTSGGCTWTASSGASWVTVTPVSGSGPGTVAFTVAANAVTASRTATLTIGGQTYTITQAAAPCAFTLNSTNLTATPVGGTGTLTVTTTGGCAWTATSGVSWATVSPASGSGTGTVTFTVAANSGTSARTGTLSVAGQAVSLTQAASTPPGAPTNVKIIIIGG